MAGEGEGRQAIRGNPNPELLFELADEGGIGCLPGLDLAAGELPKPRQRPAGGTLGQQHAPVGIDEGAGNDKQNVQAHAYAPAQQTPPAKVLARCRTTARGLKNRSPRGSPPSVLAAPQRRSHRTEATLAAVISIDGDVIVRQIAGPDRGLGGPNPDVGMDQDLAALHIGGDRAFDIVGRSLPIARHFMWAKSDRELVAFRRLTGLADGHDDAAPVRVLAKNCRL